MKRFVRKKKIKPKSATGQITGRVFLFFFVIKYWPNGLNQCTNRNFEKASKKVIYFM